MPLVGDETVRVEIDGDWYEIKTALGWYEQKKTGMAEAVTLGVPTAVVDKGKLEAGDVFQVKIGTADVILRKLQLYLVGWSHSAPRNEENIKRIPPAHVDAILGKIKELEAGKSEEAEAVPTPPSNGS